MAGAHPEVLAAIVNNNNVQTAGYGSDDYCERAKALIREACAAPNAAVHFLIGGTQTNSTVLDALLSRVDGVLAAESAHINVHEAGAVELFSHKVITLPSHEGKLCPQEVADYLRDFYADDTYTHMVSPGAVYISFSTEFGTLYSLSELEQLSAICHEYDIPLYIDGARMAYGLAAPTNGVSLADIARLADVFYIGGTKCGLMFGEAVVAPNPQRLPHFFPLVKQHGALMAKGRLLGVQFGTLFRDGLYQRLGQQAVALALRLRQGFVDAGYQVALESPTNQQFFILPNEVIDRLRQIASFEDWGPRGATHTTVRFVCGWATTEADVEELLQHLS